MLQYNNIVILGMLRCVLLKILLFLSLIYIYIHKMLSTNVIVKYILVKFDSILQKITDLRTVLVAVWYNYSGIQENYNIHVIVLFQQYFCSACAAFTLYILQ